MRFKKLYVGISLFLFLLTGLTAHAFIRTVTGTVTKVSDGDTIHVTTPEGTKLKVRLYGIDAPETGRYHLVRLIRSNLKLNIFGETFNVPPELKLEYVVATINVKEQKLKLFLDKTQVEEFDYKLR